MQAQGRPLQGSRPCGARTPGFCSGLDLELMPFADVGCRVQGGAQGEDGVSFNGNRKLSEEPEERV